MQKSAVNSLKDLNFTSLELLPKKTCLWAWVCRSRYCFTLSARVCPSVCPSVETLWHCI